jgi:hypothetical protein
MINLKLWIDQLLEAVLNENEHFHLGKLKWLSKFRKYKNSNEEVLNTQESDVVITNSQGNFVVVDKNLPSSTPVGSLSVNKMSKKRKRKFIFSSKSKSRGA